MPNSSFKEFNPNNVQNSADGRGVFDPYTDARGGEVGLNELLDNKRGVFDESDEEDAMRSRYDGGAEGDKSVPRAGGGSAAERLARVSSGVPPLPYMTDNMSFDAPECNIPEPPVNMPSNMPDVPESPVVKDIPEPPPAPPDPLPQPDPPKRGRGRPRSVPVATPPELPTTPGMPEPPKNSEMEAEGDSITDHDTPSVSALDPMESVQNAVFEHVCKRVVEGLRESHKSQMYMEGFCKGLFDALLKGERCGDNPLLASLVQECISAGDMDPFLGAGLTADVLQWILQQ